MKIQPIFGSTTPFKAPFAHTQAIPFAGQPKADRVTFSGATPILKEQIKTLKTELGELLSADVVDVNAFNAKKEELDRLMNTAKPTRFVGDITLTIANNKHFRGANLAGINLSNTQLVYPDKNTVIDFRNTNLSGANLSFAYLAYANFLRADLSNANLSVSYCIFAYFGFADLSNANLSNADLSGTDINHAIFTNAVQTGIIGAYTVRNRENALNFNPVAA